MKTIFLRVLEASDKAAALQMAIRQPDVLHGRQRFEVAIESLKAVPGSPFAYWVSERLRSLFTELPPLEGGGRTVKQGVGTGNDYRFVRTWWEVPANNVRDRWFPFAKGGAFSRFYADVYLVVNWAAGGREMYAFNGIPFGGSGAPMRNPTYYFRPGLTWSDRTTRLFSSRIWPSGGVFSVKGSAGFFSGEEFFALGLLNSLAFNLFLSILVGAGDAAARSYQIGVISCVPWPESDSDVSELARHGWSIKRSLDTRMETSHAFTLPALMQVDGIDMVARSKAWSGHVHAVEAKLAAVQAEIDERCFQLYGIDEADRRAITGDFGGDAAATKSSAAADETEIDIDEDSEEEDLAVDTESLAAELIAWAVGVAFGRFDVRLAMGTRSQPVEPEPFDPLPVCSAGMLTDSDSLPCKRPPKDYLIAWPDDGLLVDDPGIGGMVADRDILRRFRQVIETMWRNKASDIEQELCGLLGARDIREYLRKPAGFFEHHLKRYSKSRRKAPIYWPLSTTSGGYTVWIYYPRLTADTLYKVIAEHVAPKIAKVEDRIAQLEGRDAKQEGREGARAGKELSELVELLADLKDMRNELLRVANLPYKPDLNDGVQITAAPLWRLFRLPRWRSELEKTWKALEKGEHDWAHLAYAIWPERVKEKCKIDKSLAIAHGLESLYEEPSRDGAGEGSRRRGSRAGGARERSGR